MTGQSEEQDKYRNKFRTPFGLLIAGSIIAGSIVFSPIEQSCFAACFVVCQEETTAKNTPESGWQIRHMHSVGTPDKAQTNTIKNVLLLPDGDRVLTCGLDGTICLWDISEAKIVRRFHDHECTAVYCMALLDDGKRVLAGGAGAPLSLWNVDTGELIRTFNLDRTIYAISLFDDQQSFVCGDNSGIVYHCKIDEEDPVKQFRDGGEDITAVRVTPDQTGFVSGNGDGEIALWKLDQDNAKIRFTGLENWTCCLRYSDDGKQLLGSDYSGNVVLWSSETQKQIWRNENLSGDICWGHFVGDTQIVLVDSDNSYFVVERATGKATKRSIVIPNAAGFDLSLDKKILWSGGTNLLCGWNIETGERIFPDDHAMQFAEGVKSIAVKDNRIYVVADDPVVTVWDVNQPEQPGQISGLAKKLRIDWDEPRLFALQRGLAIGSSEGYVIADYETGRLTAAKAVDNEGFQLSMTENSLTYVDSNDARIQKIDTVTGRAMTLVDVADDEHSIHHFEHIDENLIAAVVTRHPELLLVWSVPDEKILAQRTSSEEFELISAGDGMLVGTFGGSEVVVFRKSDSGRSELDESSIRRLLDQLNSDSYAVRQTARDDLVAGGQLTLDLLEMIESPSIEIRSQISQLKQRVASANVPILERTLDAKKSHANLDREPNLICADPAGRYFLMTVDDGWKSELMICQVKPNEWSVVKRQSLRSRANIIQPVIKHVNNRDNVFVIGYLDGTIDIVEVIPE